jgi:predicted nucleotide-binding protein
VAAEKEWISAATASALLARSLGTFKARQAIAKRAADSLIRSRAQRFIRESPAMRTTETQDNVELPAQFWWARGEPALVQDWDTGDFDTWIANIHHWRAFNVHFLKSDIEALLANLPPPPADDASTAPKVVRARNRKVFIVHGREHAPREAVARFLEKLAFEPIILDEQANQGRAVIEKIEEYGDVGFAVVLLTPDDEGCLKGGTPEPRARQNVLLELGYFIGKLTRQRVCTLKVGEVEIPSDWRGVIDEPYDEAGSWKMTLARELQAAEYEIDWNEVMGPPQRSNKSTGVA